MAKLEQTFLCASKDNYEVYYDPIGSHAATHLQDTPQLKQLVTQVLTSMELAGKEVATHVDMGRVVGTCDVVSVTDKDTIVYAKRKNRDDDGLVPFVKSRGADPCRFVTVHVLPQLDKTYELLSAWIATYGDDGPFPQSAIANERSQGYWNRHAFVWGSQEIQPGTLQAERPW